MLTRTNTPSDSIKCSNGKHIKFEFIPNLKSYYNSIKTINAPKEIFVHPSDSIKINTQVINTSSETINFTKPEGITNELVYVIFNEDGKAVDSQPVLKLNEQNFIAQDTLHYSISIPPITKTGAYELLISVQSSKLRPALNGAPISVVVQ